VDGLEYRRHVTGIAYGSHQLGFTVTDGPSLLVKFDRVAWTADPQVHSDISTQIYLIDDDLGYAVGGGIDHPDVLRWDGSHWSTIDTTGITSFTPTPRGVGGVRVE